MAHDDVPVFGKLHVDPSWKIAVIRSVWYPELTSSLANDASAALRAAGIDAANILTMDAPGSYELPLLAKKALERGADGVIVFGIIVQGATQHARLVAEQSAAGCMQVQLELGKPVIYEVLFVSNIDDAQTRAIGPKAKGALAAKTLLSQLANLRDLH